MLRQIRLKRGEGPGSPVKEIIDVAQAESMKVQEALAILRIKVVPRFIGIAKHKACAKYESRPYCVTFCCMMGAGFLFSRIKF